MKANHNIRGGSDWDVEVVSNGSKILKWKQITTRKGIKKVKDELFLMVQRY